MTFLFNGFIFILLIAGLQFSSSAQEIIIPEQTTTAPKKASENQNKNQGYGMFSMFSGNPGRAALYSLALPGAGQFYNKKYWKIPIVLAIEGTVLALVIDRVNTYREWNDGMMAFSNGTITSFNNRTSLSDIKAVRDIAQANRDYAIIALVITHLFQTAEAFVNRHLIEFDVSEDLSITIPETTPIGISLTYRFN